MKIVKILIAVMLTLQVPTYAVETTVNTIEEERKVEIGKVFDTHIETLKNKLEKEKQEREGTENNEQAERIEEHIKFVTGKYEFNDKSTSGNSIRVIRGMFMHEWPEFLLALQLSNMEKTLLEAIKDLKPAECNGIVLQYVLYKSLYVFQDQSPLQMTVQAITDGVVELIRKKAAWPYNGKEAEWVSQNEALIREKFSAAAEDILRYFAILELKSPIQQLSRQMPDGSADGNYTDTSLRIEYYGILLRVASGKKIPYIYGVWNDLKKSLDFDTPIHHGNYISHTKKRLLR
ncbi:MAG: hypothetical protein LBF56_03580 [Holosporales bacterium]|nr:hypothetical protein [Holosporales bacterium]